MKGGTDLVDVTPILWSGVYFLSWKGTVVYVGQAKRLLARIYTHRDVLRRAKKGQKTMINGRWQRAIPFDQVQVIPCTIDDLNKLEKEWIAKLRPKYNTHHIPIEKVSLASLGLVVGGITLNLTALSPEPSVVGGVRRI